MKEILIYDSTPLRRMAHVAALRKLDCNLWIFENGAVDMRNRPVTKNFDLILLHGNDKLGFDTLGVSGPVLFYGGDIDFSNSRRVPRAVDSEAPLSNEELRMFLNALEQVGGCVIDAVTAVWGGVPESLLSWALLDAYGSDGVSSTKRKDIEAAATTELRSRSNSPDAELTRKSARELIASLRQDF
jgi:hypothetical protein